MHPAAMLSSVCVVTPAAATSAVKVANVRFHRRRIERLIAGATEHRRKEIRLNPPEQHVAIRDRQRPAATISRRPRIGTRRLRPDSQSHAIETTNRSTTRGDRVNLHDRRTQSHAGDFSVERALVLTGVMSDVGRRATHVEADDLFEPRLARRANRADDATRRAGENRILALKLMRIGQPTRRLHELQPHARQLRSHLLHVPTQAPAIDKHRPPWYRRATPASSAGSPGEKRRPA